MDLDLKLQNIQTLMLNAYWEFHNSTKFTPYIGAGIGLAFLQTDGSVTPTMTRGQSSERKVYKQDIGPRTTPTLPGRWARAAPMPSTTRSRWI